jgi:hypothetical protein
MVRIGHFHYYVSNYIKVKQLRLVLFFTYNNLISYNNINIEEMSQSDYIKHKKIATELLYQTDLPPVLNSGDYTSFFGYHLENTIIDTKPTLDQLVPSASQLVFNIKLQTKYCQDFSGCILTNKRPNRVLNGNVPDKTAPFVTPLRPLTDKQLSKYVDITVQGSDLCQCSKI